MSPLLVRGVCGNASWFHQQVPSSCSRHPFTGSPASSRIALASWRVRAAAKISGPRWKRGASKVDVVVSLLEPSEVHELELREQGTLCAEHGIEFRSFPIPDRGTPRSPHELSVLIEELHGQLL